jgi:hypothetical protein
MVLLLSAVSCGCSTKGSEKDMHLDKLFEGYRLLLVDGIPKDLSIREIKSTTLRNTYPSETTFRWGRVYLFRKLTKESEYDLGTTILPNRLKGIGAKIIRAPKSPGDFVDIYVGGPLFTIEFEQDGHKGLIRNDSHILEKMEDSWYELMVIWE